MTDWRNIWPESVDAETGEDAAQVDDSPWKMVDGDVLHQDDMTAWDDIDGEDA